MAADATATDADATPATPATSTTTPWSGAQSFGELVLVVGDFHIPQRVPSIDLNFARLWKPSHVHYVLCTGNLNDVETLNYVKSLAPKKVIVKGPFDVHAESNSNNNNNTTPLPEETVVEIAGWRIGIIHGHQIIPHNSAAAAAVKARKLDVDILVRGDSHQASIHKVDDGSAFIVDPGSATGAHALSGASVVPSFILMSLRTDDATVYLYKIVNEAVQVSKQDIKRPQRAIDQSS